MINFKNRKTLLITASISATVFVLSFVLALMSMLGEDNSVNTASVSSTGISSEPSETFSEVSEYSSIESSSVPDSSLQSDSLESSELSSVSSSQESQSQSSSSSQNNVTVAPTPQPSSSSSSSSQASESTVKPPTTNTADELRAVWISYLDLGSMFGSSGSQFTANFSAAMGKISSAGYNSIIVQVRPFGDALYNSSYFPYSHTITGVQGRDPGYDPLAIMIQQARAYGLEIHAWINPYRITEPSRLSTDNQAYTWYNDKASYPNYVELIDGRLYYNPAIPEVTQLIVNGVVEIVKNYDIDGIHFDDYFYPTTASSFDSVSYNSYKSAGGKLSLADFRRYKTSEMVKAVYSAVKKTDSTVDFGISPQGNVSNNYNYQFADVGTWMANSGYIDYICPQIYYGFENSSLPYVNTVAQWASLPRVSGIDVYIGIAAYKVGVVDTWAGSGKNEWVNSTDMLARMVTTTRENSGVSGFVMFRYDNLFKNPSSHMQKELDNLEEVL